MQWLLLVVLASVACRVMLGQWPWNLLGAKRTSGFEIEQAKALLGVSSNARATEINEAHRRLIARIHPDRGGTTEQVHAANAARDLLLSHLQTSRG